MDINIIEVGQRIKNIRMNLGESMDAFGSRFNTSRGTVNNWEKGRNLPNNKNLLRISELGNLSINELLYGNFENYIKQRLIPLIPECADELQLNQEQFDTIFHDAANNVISNVKENEYNISDTSLKKYIILAIKKNTYLDGELDNNDLLNYNFTLIDTLVDNEYYFPTLALDSKFSDKKLFTSFLGIINLPNKIIYIDDLNVDRFYNLISDEIHPKDKDIFNDLSKNKIIKFSTYIKYRSKVEKNILKEILELVFLSLNINIAEFTVKLLEDQLIRPRIHKFVKK